MILNIIIPSYNRYEYLAKKLDTLKPQLNERTKIVVLNNCSPDPRYQQLKEKYGFANIIHHPLNIGLVGNILRAYEYVNEGYLWILSDDDWISADVVEKIQEAMSSDPDHIYLSFDGRGENITKEGEKIYSSSEFVQSFSCVSTIGFISANIFNYEFIKEHIYQGYLAGRTLFPHVAIFFSALSQKNNVSVKIIKNCVSFNSEENTYPELHYMTFLNHFDLGNFLNKKDEKAFRLFYIKTWGVDIFQHSFKRNVLCRKIKEMRSIWELIALFNSIAGGVFRRFRRIIVRAVSNG